MQEAPPFRNKAAQKSRSTRELQAVLLARQSRLSAIKASVHRMLSGSSQAGPAAQDEELMATMEQAVGGSSLQKEQIPYLEGLMTKMRGLGSACFTKEAGSPMASKEAVNFGLSRSGSGSRNAESGSAGVEGDCQCSALEVVHKYGTDKGRNARKQKERRKRRQLLSQVSDDDDEPPRRRRRSFMHDGLLPPQKQASTSTHLAVPPLQHRQSCTPQSSYQETASIHSTQLTETNNNQEGSQNDQVSPAQRGRHSLAQKDTKSPAQAQDQDSPSSASARVRENTGSMEGDRYNLGSPGPHSENQQKWGAAGRQQLLKGPKYNPDDVGLSHSSIQTESSRQKHPHSKQLYSRQENQQKLFSFRNGSKFLSGTNPHKAVNWLQNRKQKVSESKSGNNIVPNYDINISTEKRRAILDKIGKRVLLSSIVISPIKYEHNNQVLSQKQIESRFRKERDNVHGLVELLRSPKKIWNSPLGKQKPNWRMASHVMTGQGQ